MKSMIPDRWPDRGEPYCPQGPFGSRAEAEDYIAEAPARVAGIELGGSYFNDGKWWVNFTLPYVLRWGGRGS